MHITQQLLKRVYWVRQHFWDKLRHEKYLEGGKLHHRKNVPSFDCTRTVHYINGIISCSCCLFKRMGIACCHIYCILDNPPNEHHIHFKNLKCFQTYYGIDAHYTATFDRAWTENNTDGIQFLEELDGWNETRSSQAADWFAQALPDQTPVLRPHLAHTIYEEKN